MCEFDIQYVCVNEWKEWRGEERGEGKGREGSGGERKMKN